MLNIYISYIYIVGADDTGLGGRFSRGFLAHDMGFMYQFCYDVQLHMGHAFFHFFDRWHGNIWSILTRILGLPGKHICNLFLLRIERCNNPNAISTVCELVDMTCFASFRAQTIAEVLCHVIFSRHFTDCTGLIHFSVFFHFADDMGVCVFGYVRLLPCHLQVLYIYRHIYIYHQWIGHVP